jgi:diguanylate cyclase (GGDEF)-like protein
VSTPLPDASAPDRALARLARKWAYQVSMTSYIPLPHKEIERQLRELAHEVFEVVAAEPVDVDRAAAVGERLVKLHCVGKASLRCSVDVLAGALLAEEHTGGRAERVARALGALACGYAETVRWHTVEQQDSLNRALLEAVRKAEERRKVHEAQHDEVVTELALLRSRFSHQLLHDVLTALPNRQFFTTRLEHVLNTGSPTTVYHLEVGGLDTISDGLGPLAAASLLRTVADRLQGLMAGEHAMVARFELSRFAVLVESRAPAPDPAPVVAAINAVLAEPAHVAGHAVIMSASTGVVQSPPHRADPATMLHAAHMALRKAKLLGPGRFVLLGRDCDGEDRQELRLAATLAEAWRAGHVRVEFRPQVRRADGSPPRLDARLRWDHTELGPLPHERCVALAERTGLGVRLGNWLLDEAGERLRSWSGDLPLTVAVPASQATDPNLLTAIGESGLPAERLRLSVPADIATGPAADNLTRLADAGVTVSVHDFGAGDVTCLADVPVHAVRLAKPLVERSAEPLVGQAARNTVALAHQAGAAVVVDGISTGQEAERWRGMAADLATGPLFPLPAQLRTLLRENRK